VHPLLLAAKRLALHGPWTRWLDDDVRRYEAAYARGARDAARRPGGATPDREGTGPPPVGYPSDRSPAPRPERSGASEANERRRTR
ncbi:MAG: hypothetical protein WD336_07585, partial [Trueperaceae bacterium]